jgi:hypothetical protein
MSSGGLKRSHASPASPATPATFRRVVRQRVEMLGSQAFREQCIEEGSDCTLGVVPLLQQMNTLGFVTFDSQVGGAKLAKDGAKIVHRSFVSGFMKKKAAAKFLKSMNLNTTMLCMLIPHASKIDHVDPRMDIPLTVVFKKGQEPRVATHMSSVVPHVTHGTFLKHAGLRDVEEPLDHIFCLDLQWERHAADKEGLFTKIAQQLQK